MKNSISAQTYQDRGWGTAMTKAWMNLWPSAIFYLSLLKRRVTSHRVAEISGHIIALGLT